MGRKRKKRDKTASESASSDADAGSGSFANSALAEQLAGLGGPGARSKAKGAKGRRKKPAAEPAPAPEPSPEPRAPEPPPAAAAPAGPPSDEELFARAVADIDRAEIHDAKYGTRESARERAELAGRERVAQDPDAFEAASFEEAMRGMGIARMSPKLAQKRLPTGARGEATLPRPSIARENVGALRRRADEREGRALSKAERKLVDEVRRSERQDGPVPTITLRGLGAEDALHELDLAARQWRAASVRFARVITGKGHGSAGEPVLKGVARSFFEARDEIVEHARDTDPDGTFGAWLVRLRRR